MALSVSRKIYREILNKRVFSTPLLIARHCFSSAQTAPNIPHSAKKVCSLSLSLSLCLPYLFGCWGGNGNLVHCCKIIVLCSQLNAAFVCFLGKKVENFNFFYLYCFGIIKQKGKKSQICNDPTSLGRYCLFWGLISLTVLFSLKTRSNGGKCLYTLKEGHFL